MATKVSVLVRVLPSRMDGLLMVIVSVSSLRIVPVPWLLPSVTAIGPAPDVLRFDSWTAKTLSGSTVVLPFTFTVIVPVRLPAGMVSVPVLVM